MIHRLVPELTSIRTGSDTPSPLGEKVGMRGDEIGWDQVVKVGSITPFHRVGNEVRLKMQTRGTEP